MSDDHHRASATNAELCDLCESIEHSKWWLFYAHLVFEQRDICFVVGNRRGRTFWIDICLSKWHDHVHAHSDRTGWYGELSDNDHRHVSANSRVFHLSKSFDYSVRQLFDTLVEFLKRDIGLALECGVSRYERFAQRLSERHDDLHAHCLWPRW